jgi:hypothetical protein
MKSDWVAIVFVNQVFSNLEFRGLQRSSNLYSFACLAYEIEEVVFYPPLMKSALLKTTDAR